LGRKANLLNVEMTPILTYLILKASKRVL